MNDAVFQVSDVGVLVAIGTLIMIALAMLMVAYSSKAQKKMMQQRMDTQALELRYQQELVQKNLLTQEEERQRIASNLHDDIGSKLGVLHLTFHRLNRMPAGSTEQSEMFGEIDQLIATTLNSVRRISHELLPPTLEDFGLIEALKELIEPIHKSSGIDIRFESTLEKGDFDNPQTELNLFRVVQEMLNNSIKHAAATHILIEMGTEGTNKYLLYRDNGRGFDQDAVQRRGLGLKNLESRARIIGAQTTFQSKPGAGFEARFDF
ncbi:MAG: sensor histidine kinase [Saprospiraceae bacterium]|nr:sensor histidine kinase [Saprospiraceae bacterium]